MQEEKSPHKRPVKKSSFELEEDEQPEDNLLGQSHHQPQQPSADKTDSLHENLLDLEMDASSQQEYRMFLQDRIVVIEGPELVTENVLKSYKLYKIKSRKKTDQHYETVVARRFSDFEYLQRELIEEYGGYIIPLLPEKNFWANVNMEGEAYMQKRAKDLEKYLRSLLGHEKLRMTVEVKNFLFSDEARFSQEKGQFFSKIKTEEKIYSFAESAYNLSKGILTRFISGHDYKELEPPQIQKPTLEDLKLMEYQSDVGGLVKILNVLRQLVENTATEMRVIYNLEKGEREIGQVLPHEKLLHLFEDLCKYIISCNEALKRRHALRVSIDGLNGEYESMQKKIKSNPRSQDVDILRNKLARATEQCAKWTESLLGELERSVRMGKSMVEDFIEHYTQEKERFYKE